MRKGIILINAYTQSESELFQPNRLREELEKLNVSVMIARNVCFNGAEDYDFCVYLDKDKYTARKLEGAGVRLFNRAQAIETCDDKMLTHIALHGFLQPRTISAPLCYTSGSPVSEALLDHIECEIGYPVVVKECFGSLGKGVYKAENREELQEICKKLQQKPHLFQEYIATGFGKDVRAVVVGGKFLCAMKRSSGSGDFRSNIGAGGTGEPFELDGNTKAVCEDIAKRLQLDFCGIDLLFGERGFVVCEVNSNAFFATTERVTGVNVARAYAEHIVSEIYG